MLHVVEIKIAEIFINPETDYLSNIVILSEYFEKITAKRLGLVYVIIFVQEKGMVA